MLDLRASWRDLLARRGGLTDSLEAYGRVIEAWAGAPLPPAALGWPAERCRRCWADGMPLLAAAAPSLVPAEVEDLLALAMEVVAGIRPEVSEALARLAEAWDRGDATPAQLLPAPGGIGRLEEGLGLPADVTAFLAVASLRPRLEPYLAACRPHLRDGDWEGGACPFCGAPPGFGDIVEDGRRRLACHLCGGAWTFARLRCPFCGTDDSAQLRRLELEAPADQGYFLATCTRCGAYLKELDRRVRWNGGPALLEDWGSPHFDLAATARGLARPLAPVILAR